MENTVLSLAGSVVVLFCDPARRPGPFIVLLALVAEALLLGFILICPTMKGSSLLRAAFPSTIETRVGFAPTVTDSLFPMC